MTDQTNEIVIDPKTANASLRSSLAAIKYCFNHTVNIENNNITENEKNSFSSCLKLYYDLLNLK